MEPIILGDDTIRWEYLAIGVGLIGFGVVAWLRDWMDASRRIGLTAVGVLSIALVLLGRRNRVELHEDKIVQHLQPLFSERTEILLSKVTKVEIVDYEEDERKKQMWMFFHGKDHAQDFLPAGVWRHHRGASEEFLTRKGIEVTGPR